MRKRQIVLTWILGLGLIGCSQCAGTTLRYTALGDSITFGSITSHPCSAKTPVDVATQCSDGTAWSDRLAQLLAATQPVQYQNLGISGIRTRGVIEHELPVMQPDLDLITLYIGTNDASKLSDILEGGGSNDGEYANVVSDYKTLVETLQSRYPKAKIILLNIRNLKLLEYYQNRQDIDSLSLRINREIINPWSDQGLKVIDLLCDPKGYLVSENGEGSHPNDEGSWTMARKVFAALAATVPAPKSTCPPYAP